MARTHWERIEPVAEIFGDLDPLIDEREPDVEPGTDFTGFHRIEKQLWVSGNTKGMGPVADQLLTNARSRTTSGCSPATTRRGWAAARTW